MRGPGHGAVQEGVEDTGCVDKDLSCVSLLFVLCQCVHTVVAALRMRLFSLASRQRESEIVEPVYMKSWTTFSSLLEILMSGDELASCSVTCVFLRLILKSLHGWLTQL